jgi:hypothetical protein
MFRHLIPRRHRRSKVQLAVKFLNSYKSPNKPSTNLSDKFLTSSITQFDPRVLLTKYYSGDHINNNVMGGACGTYGGKELTRFQGRQPKEGEHFKDRRRWENDTGMDLQEVGWGDMDWIDLAQDRDRWRALVKAVMNLWVT